MNPYLSILIPAVESRLVTLALPLFKRLTSQVRVKGEVEVLLLLDNKTRSVGLKRDALVQAAQGSYLSFVDDDDWISEDYVESILTAIQTERIPPDVIVFNQQCTINDENPFVVRHGIEYENEAARKEGEKWMDIKRKPWHHCAWRTKLAQGVRFADASYGEDWHWCERVLVEVETQARIDKVLHYYRFNEKVTEAAATFPPA